MSVVLEIQTLETNRNNGNTSAKLKRQRLNEDRSSTAPYRFFDYDASGIPIDKRARRWKAQIQQQQCFTPAESKYGENMYGERE